MGVDLADLVGVVDRDVGLQQDVSTLALSRSLSWLTITLTSQPAFFSTARRSAIGLRRGPDVLSDPDGLLGTLAGSGVEEIELKIGSEDFWG